ncbi:hypothetical protein BDY17DRAFT_326793 [Neohortaea acidophila]|uniref:Uncharacterized protein n=1 Tax=Neohortaea acidophila TaxID=245834 RepID=A0A6A6PLR0_9PEZI|nr:uncharacterized protein BDY17DRAFT_326793 [Neohortaea acidophila]KAF2480922.1 hypothetical protein BDY17DRAFT_326793 [Neohortaea acidophila]
MDRLKGVAKGGWHPGGDAGIHRDTWKSDLKGMATGKTADKKHLETARNHTSVPLNALKDPESFGPPPKRGDAAGTSASSSSSVAPSSPSRPQPRAGGLGAPVPPPRKRVEEEEEEEPQAPPLPYRTDNTGLRTDHLPAPPTRRTPAEVPAPPPRNSSPALPSRPQQQRPAAPSPMLPPRMNEYPDEHTPPPPPSYHEAAATAVQQHAPVLNQGAVNRLGQAGVSVSGFGIGKNSGGEASQSPASTALGHAGQLSELQQRFSRNTGANNAASSSPAAPGGISAASASELGQRFARLNTGSNNTASPTSGTPSLSASHATSALNAAAAIAAHKKPPPPPPPKKAGLTDGSGAGSAAPPLPMSSKPRGT